MTEPRGSEAAVYAALFALAVTAIVFVRLLPLGAVPASLPGPDLILCLVVAWAIRRPDLLPLWALVPVLFMSDLLLMRPPGLHTALVVIVAEALRSHHARLQTLPLGWEIVLAGLISVSVSGAHWLVLALLAVDQHDLWITLSQAPINAVAYPFAILICHGLLGLRKRPAPRGRSLRGLR